MISSNEEVDEIDKTPRRTIVNGVLANKNGENNKDEDNHTSDRSTRSDITTGSSKSGSREPGRYGDGIEADQRESPTVKYGVWWILRVAHIQTIERDLRTSQTRTVPSSQPQRKCSNFA